MILRIYARINRYFGSCFLNSSEPILATHCLARELFWAAFSLRVFAAVGVHMKVAEYNTPHIATDDADDICAPMGRKHEVYAIARKGQTGRRTLLPSA